MLMGWLGTWDSNWAATAEFWGLVLILNDQS